MKLCKRAVEFVQITNEDGEVRLCSWLRDGGIIGNLTKKTLNEVYHSHEAEMIREMHSREDYSNCNPNTCPYVANGTVKDNLLEIDTVPEYPYSLYLAYENVCNYRCKMCGIPGCMDGIEARIREEKLNKIDLEIRKALPYVKHISSNGLGELFMSRHTLKLLSEWRPLANPEDVSVSLETNGSLFDPEHWEMISNLGQYKLSVAITVLSFENDIYQELSGVNYPVEKVIDNLRFVSLLRKQGIIDRLEIATVYQDLNYRQLPAFARKCVEDFEVDSVRLRPFEPWGEVGMKEWLMDVRNVYHPQHKDFLEIMRDPIFMHPKVHDWGGGRESGLGPEPYVKTRRMFAFIEQIMDDSFDATVREKIGNGKIVVYGMTAVGKSLISRLKEKYEIPYCLDRGMDGQSFMGVPIFSIDRLKDVKKDVSVIIAVHWVEDTVKRMLLDAGFNHVLGITEIIMDF